MEGQAFRKYIAGLKVKEGRKVALGKFHTEYTPKDITKEESMMLLQKSTQDLSEVQQRLYAHNRYSVLIIFQGIDAGGKDGAVRHVMSGLNPQGVKVTSFKVPSVTELDHDYLWRHYKELPARGEMGIFNRSHYENVLVTRVHPQYLLSENLPGINSVKDVDGPFWERRFKQINHFEETLSENGTLVLKFFLHLSKGEQKKRFLERIENPAKNWKFSFADMEERRLWDHYQHAFEEMLSHTSTTKAPWFIIPADNKWSARLAISELILQEMEQLKLSYPAISKEQRSELRKAKAILLKED